MTQENVYVVLISNSQLKLIPKHFFYSGLVKILISFSKVFLSYLSCCLLSYIMYMLEATSMLIVTAMQAILRVQFTN